MFQSPRQITTALAGSGDLNMGPPPYAEIDFRRIASMLWRGRSIIFLTSVLGLALALVFILVTPPKFAAMTQILIDPTDLHATGNDTSPSSQASDAAVMAVESQVRVLASDNVLRRVVDAEGLAQDPEFVGSPSANAS